jgi:hypothetical protein
MQQRHKRVQLMDLVAVLCILKMIERQSACYTLPPSMLVGAESGKGCSEEAGQKAQGECMTVRDQLLGSGRQHTVGTC